MPLWRNVIDETEAPNVPAKTRTTPVSEGRPSATTTNAHHNADTDRIPARVSDGVDVAGGDR